jgi:GH35 family endo-1,4-beta-xylanase
MKYIVKISLTVAAAAVLASCVDDTPLAFDVTEPTSIADMNYLKEYSPLKEYLPEGSAFKLGVGISASELTARGVPYRIAVANFNEWVAGNDMKYASVVGDNGAMNVANVTNFVETARAAGVGVYGHTLVWHAQQNLKWLNSLIADEVIPAPPSEPAWVVAVEQDFETDDASNYVGDASGNAQLGFTAVGEGSGGEGRALTITNSTVRANDWDAQFFVNFAPPAEAGATYRFTMDVRSDDPANIPTQAHNAPGAYVHWDYVGSIPSTTEWKRYEKEVTIGSQAGTSTIAFNLGAVATTYYFDNIKFERYYPNGLGGGGLQMVEKFVNNGFETDDATNYQANGAAQLSYVDGGVEGRALKITNPAVQANGYNAQFILKWTPPMVSGEIYELRFDYKADAAVSAGSQSQRGPGQYLGGGIGNLSFTTEWQHFERAITINEMGALAIDLGLNATSYYFDNISLKKEETVGDVIIVKTPEQKKEILTAELERWISGMMTATGANAETGATPYVKAWDLVNEPMDDGNASALKTGDRNGDGMPDNAASTDFYWQDYLGKDYARVAAKFARQYGGNDLKLFINDYNLEAVYNNNDKARGLIAMVEYWESDGVTKIDGLGTQMHVSYNMDPARQKAQEDAIVTMYELLAATGKLIKVSELDMGINDAEGNAIMTTSVTADQHKAMAAFYKFIVAKYFEIIPAAQQYGITQWAATDSPTNSGWRAGQPIGLWDANYNRKHTYAGFADGLAGK